MVDAQAEPSRVLPDVTGVPLGALRSSGLADVARRMANETISTAAIQAQDMDQYDDDFVEKK